MNDTLKTADVSRSTPGQILKGAREAKHINISEVVQRLLLSKKIVLAIEEDDYSIIPAQVYAEGYLKAYAQFLQIPAESFRRLNVYTKSEAQVVTKTQTEINWWQQLVDLLKQQSRGHLILGGATIVVLVVLVFFTGKQFTAKKAESISVAGNLDNMVNKIDQVSLGNQIPIITTTNSENSIVSETEDKKVDDNEQ
jgi:cytoskeleton protein RodZ